MSESRVTIPEWTAELIDAFETEARQLDTLVGVLRRQRDGIARDEIGPVQDSVSAIHRVLLTLDEARRRRRTLLEMVSGPQEGGHPTDDAQLQGPKERLITAARGLEAELSLNRGVLESALRSTDEEIRTVLNGLDDTSTYAADDATATRAGRLVDRQV